MIETQNQIFENVYFENVKPIFNYQLQLLLSTFFQVSISIGIDCRYLSTSSRNQRNVESGVLD